MKKKGAFEENIEKDPSGMINEDESVIINNKKKKIIIIISIVLAAIILLGAIGGTLLIVFQNKALQTPKNLHIENFDQEKDFVLLLNWDYVFNADDYTLEFIYELYPEQINSVNVVKNGYYVERKRGEIKYRVRANKGEKSGAFTQWYSFSINALQLDLPKITLVQNGNEIEMIWTEIKYKYYNDYGTVYYEILEGANGEYWVQNPSFITSNEQKTIILPPDVDLFMVKIRAINYRQFNIMNDNGIGTKKIIEYEPKSLFDIYETSDVWTEEEIEIQ